MTTDLLLLTRNRREFTVEVLAALRANTNWSWINEAVIYDDGSTDGTLDIARKSGLPVRECSFGSPVRICNDFVLRSGADLVVKLDNDFVVPPGWLDQAIAVMEAHPRLELLGLEACASATEPGYELADHVGGLFVARREMFYRRNFPVPKDTYYGFTDWQRRAGPTRGWLCPPLRAFLLDRLPFDPWRRMSHRYEALGWQRPWKRYTNANRGLWEWWTPQGGIKNGDRIAARFELPARTDCELAGV